MRMSRYIFSVIVVACLVLGCGISAASAAEAKPLEISKFSMTGTESTTVSGAVEGSTCWPCHIENVPYSQELTQAGGHPWAITFTGAFGTETLTNGSVVPTRDPKDIVINLPAGLLGNPLAVPMCPVSRLVQLGGGSPCPPSTQIGMFRLRLFGGKVTYGPIVNVTPETGQSAEIGFEIIRFGSRDNTVLATAHLIRDAEGYGIAVISKNTLPFGELAEFETTVWGVPADPSHDRVRGMSCWESGLPSDQRALLCEGGNESAGVTPVTFWSLPTDCSAGPEVATMRADSWQEPGDVVEGRFSEQFKEASWATPGVTGCNLLKFEPGLEVQPNTFAADEAVGLGVTLETPQPEEPGVDATPHLRDAVVTLPEGMSVNPSVVDGIQACNEFGPEGINISGPESEEVGIDGELQLASGHCPAASTVGTAEAITPLLASPVKGHIYLARPGCGVAALGQTPCTEHDALDGNLYKLYLELGGTGEDAKDGIEIKVPGRVEANPATGQLTTRFEGSPPDYEGNPQLPFSELRVHLNQGPRASIANPAVCGPALATADLTPWSEPGITPEGALMPGTPDAAITAKRPFVVQGCASTTPFAPGFVAGTAPANAGQFGAFTLNLLRNDREQYVKGLQIHTPPGLLGILANVPLCGEPQADQGACPEGSKIGTTRVATGAGSHPFEIEGDIYLTGPYDGGGGGCVISTPGCAPFGLSIVVHLDVGPFHLGVLVVRARIAVNREDSTLTVTTDETGPYAVPQIVFGVPVRLKRVTVDVDRLGFMFNPTHCGAMEVEAAIAGSQQAVAHEYSPFAVHGCKGLAFKPTFAVSTNGKTSRAGGASLDVKLSYPKGALGNDANIASVKVDLPKKLPSRLSTLQKACPAATFAVNPAACPTGSVVGVARSTTPLLPAPLQGPVYFVSHGGEAFPSLIVVLQGDNVRVDLRGTTFINEKTSVTSSTFKTVPDVPVDTFELYLPQGRDSALAANGNLCRAAAGGTTVAKRKIVVRVHGKLVDRTVSKRVKRAGLIMPTRFVAQNGAVFSQATKIAVAGCGSSSVGSTPEKRRTGHSAAASNERNGR